MSAESTTTAAIAGIGTVGFGEFAEHGAATLANRALEAALADCGLERGAIDGLLVQIGSPRGLDYDSLARLLALDLRFASQTWSHGRFAATLIEHAALAVKGGLSDYVVCVATFRNSLFARVGSAGFPGFAEGLREGGGPHAELHWAGLAAPIGGAAMSTRRYLDKFGIDREKLGAVPIAQRKAAALNPRAIKREPIDAAAYSEAPYVVEPLRRLDCSVMTDTAVAVIVTNEERARDLGQTPVLIRGMQGLHAGPNEFVFGEPGLGINQAATFDWDPDARSNRVYRQAGMGPEDIDTLHCYDGFSPQVLWTLERFGFCAPGEAPDWVAGGRIELGGELPVNTSGGHLSEGHSNGWGQTLEIVTQLRGQAGDRQVDDCRTAMWATTFGDAIIYGT